MMKAAEYEALCVLAFPIGGEDGGADIIEGGPLDEGIEYQDSPDADDDEGDAPEIEKV